MTNWITTTTAPEPISIDSIVGNVAQVFGVERSLIFSATRMQHVKYARWAVWLIMRSKGYTYSDIGTMFNRDHSTVINAMNKFPQDVKNVRYVREAWNKVKHL